MYDPTEPQDRAERAPRHIDECDQDPFGPLGLMAKGWIPELAVALSAGDTIPVKHWENLRAAEQRDLREALARFGLCAVTEYDDVHIRRIGDEREPYEPPAIIHETDATHPMCQGCGNHIDDCSCPCDGCGLAPRKCVCGGAL